MALAIALLAVSVLASLVLAARGVRRVELGNRAMHELRRPLQSISLALAAPAPDVDCARACLDQAVGALEGLDAAVNGRRRSRTASTTTLPQLIAALDRRWRHRGVRVLVPPIEGTLTADPLALGAALDNLVANSLDHGSGPVSVRAFASAGDARIEVRDGGPRRPGTPALADPRRGHGLEVAADAAANHGGSLTIAPAAGGEGTIAALSIPCDGGISSLRSPRAPTG